MKERRLTLTERFARKILLADDEEPVRALLAATLNGGSGYKVLEARDGIEALEVARVERPDLVLLDVMMPGMDGLEVCRCLKADPETDGIAVIILTAMAQDADRARALEAGANGYLTKPFSPSALLAKLEETLACS
ncbi:MAG: response regulator [Chloroflexi bacterium]|nr:response regulator [Chloroflexota bacterium]